MMVSKSLEKGWAKDELDRFKSLLLERRRLLLNDFQAQEKAVSQDAASGGSSHLAEYGSDREASDVNLCRRESESTEIQEIDDALERIRDASFGLCEECRRPISKVRLESIPYARLCLPCRRLEEA